MVQQPSGTVTLVFTDVEGSTRLLHELGQEAYREALGEHRRVVREAFSDGYEVDYEGDAFFYAFSSAQAAVDAVEVAMRGLREGPIRIRVGIHTGEPGLDPPKYVGVDVHKAARIMSAGHGGQVLLSRSTRELVRAEAVDLGAHRLKDLEEPVSIHQLGGALFPPLKSLNNTNLPAPARFVRRRERELEEAAGLLASARLVSITGPGGTGKARFAVELGWRQLAHFANGVFWVGLAPLREAALVLEEVRKILGAPGEIPAQIGDKQMLIVLDNFEQVVGAATEVGDLLRDCPNLSVMFARPSGNSSPVSRPSPAAVRSRRLRGRGRGSRRPAEPDREEPPSPHGRALLDVGDDP